jgi:hypothetical protein
MENAVLSVHLADLSTLATIALSTWYFTIAVILLSVMAAIFLFTAEQLILRRIVNRHILINWLTLRGFDYELDRFSRKIATSAYSLPQRQFAGALAATIHTELGLQPIGPVASSFVKIGSSLRGMPDSQSPSDKPSSSDSDSASFFLTLTDNALDDLQAFLAERWIVWRYICAMSILVVVSLFLWSQANQGDLFTLKTVLVYQAVLVGAVFVTPLMRDLIEKLVARVN